MAISKKKMTRFIYIFSAIVALAIGIVLYFANQEMRTLRKEGIRSEARIIGKHTEGSYSRKGRTKKRYYLSLAFFADTAQTEVKTIKPKSDNINDKMDALFDNIAAERVTGDYTSGTLGVSNTTYAKLKEGDKITVVYLKDRPETARLLSEIE